MTNGETFIKLLNEMKLYMEKPPFTEPDGYDVLIRFSKEWWDRPQGHKRCQQCGEWFEATRKSHIYCKECGKERKREAQKRWHKEHRR